MPRFIQNGVVACALSALVLSCAEQNGLEFEIDGLHAVSQQTGIRTGSTDSKSAGMIEFTVFSPSGSASTIRPLVIALHGGGSRASQLSFGYVQSLVEPGFRDLRPIIVAPDLPRTAASWADQISIAVVLDFIEAAQTVWNIDQEKIVITGYSVGGLGVWTIAGRYPELFSAAIPVASDVVIGNLRGSYEVPFYAIHGTDDEVFNIDMVRTEIGDALALGACVTLVEIDGASHSQLSAYRSELTIAAQWLVQEIW